MRRYEGLGGRGAAAVGGQRRGRAGKIARPFCAEMIPVPEHSPGLERIGLMDRRRKAANDNERRLDRGPCRRGPRHVSLEERLLAELSYGYAT